MPIDFNAIVAQSDEFAGGGFASQAKRGRIFAPYALLMFHVDKTPLQTNRGIVISKIKL